MAAAPPLGSPGSSSSWLVAVLVVLGLVLGDRYAEQRVEREAAAQLQDELGTPAPPAVDVEGWPFLTQAVGQRLPRVHVVADDLTAQSDTGRRPSAHADLILTRRHDHRTGTRRWRRAASRARARVDYDALAVLAGLPLTLRPAAAGCGWSGRPSLYRGRRQRLP